eukprot:11179080-Lingulodinium_polyedra.AAC.1
MSLEGVYISLHKPHGRNFVLFSKAIRPRAPHPAAHPRLPAARRGGTFLGLSAKASINNVDGHFLVTP